MYALSDGCWAKPREIIVVEKSAGLEPEPGRAAFGRVYYVELGPRAERYERQEKLQPLSSLHGNEYVLRSISRPAGRKESGEPVSAGASQA